MRILKVIDQFGWAYDFVAREQQKFSKHEIFIKRYKDITDKDLNIDLLYLPSPEIDALSNWQLINKCKSKGIKVIGGYSGGDILYYPNVDLVLSINFSKMDQIIKYNYHNNVIFIPEGIDDEYFKVDNRSTDKFIVGWAGRPTPVKRPYLLNKLKYSVIKKDNWGHEFFKENRSLDPMLDFYKMIDTLILVSKDECCPRVIFEAMACGLPVIATNVGSIPIILNEEFIISSDENEIISQANNILYKLENDIEYRTNSGNNNLNIIKEKFSWNILQPIWDNIFESVINEDSALLKNTLFKLELVLNNKHILHIKKDKEYNLNSTLNLLKKYEDNKDIKIIKNIDNIIEIMINVKTQLFNKLINELFYNGFNLDKSQTFIKGNEKIKYIFVESFK